MKRIIILTLSLSLAFACFSQTTYTVGVGEIFDFNNVQEAHDAAADGDTLLIHPFVSANISVSKTIYFVGTGYFLDQNPKTQADANSSNLRIEFLEGSQGCVIEGFDLNATSQNFSIDNISIIRSRFSLNQTKISGNNILIQNCWIGSTQGLQIEGENLIIKNSILVSPNPTIQQANQSVLFEGNVASAKIIFSFRNSIFRNSIFFNDDQTSNSPTTNTYINNIIQNIPPELDGVNGNFDVEDLNTVFIGFPTIGEGQSNDGRFQIRDGSPSIGAGLNGVDIGPFSSPNPYVLSGMPARPSIYEINMPSDAGTNPILNVQVKVKAH